MDFIFKMPSICQWHMQTKKLIINYIPKWLKIYLQLNKAL